MKVIIVSQPFDMVMPPNQSSVGVWTYEIAQRLASDCDTTVIARRLRGMPSRMDSNGVHLEFLRCAPARLWNIPSRLWSRARPGSSLVAQSFYGLEYLGQVMRVIRRLSPDLVHIQNFPQYVPAIRRAAPNAAIVLHMHCDWLAELDRNAVKRGLAAADLVVGCSEYVVSAARRRFVEMDTAFAILPNGAPENLHSGIAPPIAGKILFVGRISPEKGVHTLLSAWPAVVEACPEARLEIVGPSASLPREFLVDLSTDDDVRGLDRFYPGGSAYHGTYEAALRAIIPPTIAHTITFTGAQPYESVVRRYAEASLLVNPSLSESFGMSLVEALSSATPVLVTRVGGMPEIIEATGGGVVVEKNDPIALAAEIIRLLRNPRHAAELGRKGAAKIPELFGWDNVARSTRDLYKKAVETRYLNTVKKVHSSAQQRALKHLNTEPVSSPHSQLTASPTRRI